jgi:hypothetical protein
MSINRVGRIWTVRAAHRPRRRRARRADAAARNTVLSPAHALTGARRRCCGG